LAEVLARCSALAQLTDDHQLVDEVQMAVAVLQAMSDPA
jgi:hypothetical protein